MAASDASSPTTTAATTLRVLPARPVRVLLGEGLGVVRISSTKPHRVIDATGKVRKLKPGTRTLAASRQLLKGLKSPLRFDPGVAPLQLDGAGYRGSLVSTARGRALTVVNHLPLDRYLRGVVPWEMPEDWHPRGSACAGGRRAFLRARDPEARQALRSLRRHPQPGLWRDPGGRADDEPGDRRHGGPCSRLAQPDRDDLLPLDVGRPHRLRRRRVAEGEGRAVSRLGAGPARQHLEAPPLGAVPDDPRGDLESDGNAGRPRRAARACRLRTRDRRHDQGWGTARSGSRRRISGAPSASVRRGSRFGC